MLKDSITTRKQMANYESMNISELKAAMTAIKGLLVTKKEEKALKSATSSGAEKVPKAYADFTKKVREQHAEEYAAFKAENAGMSGSVPNFVKSYRAKDGDAEWTAFRDAWNLEHPKAAPAVKVVFEVTQKKRGPKKNADCTPEELAARKEKREASKAAKEAKKQATEQVELLIDLVPTKVPESKKVGLKKRGPAEEVSEPVKRSPSPEAKEKED